MGVIVVTIVTTILTYFDYMSVGMFALSVVASFVWACIAGNMYFKSGFLKGYYHNFLGWHTPGDSPIWGDECNTHAICKYCGKHIMQDSQGNWF